MSSASPSQLGRYEIQAVLGKGSMGVVYLARDPLIGRLVALKTFRPSAGADDEDAERFRARFLREAQSAGILSHPNIVTVHDVVESSAEDETFIAMEYVQGTNLKEVLRYGKALEMGEVVEIFHQMAGALDYAHERGVVHRDIKPANVLLTPQRQVKITDFGIARFEASNLTHDGQLLGTPNYMSPEQVQGREVDRRTDLFSLGVVLYEMIARHKPFSGENLTAVTHRIVYDQHTPLSDYVGGLPEPLGALIDRALAKDPDHRFQNAGDMAAELARLVAVYEQQIALSETQSIAPGAAGDATFAMDRSPGAGGTDDDDSRSATLPGGGLAGPPPPPDAPGDTSVTGPARGTGDGASDTTEANGVGTSVAGGGVLYGFRRWLKPEPGFGAPDWPRLALVAVVVALLVTGFGALILGWMEPEVEPVAESMAEERLEREFLEAWREGIRANEAGDPEAAAAAFRRAEALRPDEPRVRRLREAAERRAEMETMSELARERLALQTAAADEALAAGRYQEALSTATVVLESEPENEIAGRVADEARTALARAARQRQVAREEERAAEGGEADPSAGAEEEAAATGPASLAVLLETEGEGRLVVEVDGVLMVDVGYEYVDRVGLFRRKKPYRGVTRLPGVEVEPGSRELRYEVRPDDGPAQTGTMEVEFPAGETRSLILDYTPDRALVAHLE